jgi:hypothetical protein
MIMIGNVIMIDRSAKKINGTNEKCGGIIVRMNETGTIDKSEKSNAMIIGIMKLELV